MKTNRKIIVYTATSADGYIARPDGDVEWLNRRPDSVVPGVVRDAIQVAAELDLCQIAKGRARPPSAAGVAM
jgi:hypothetical protein